MRGWTLSIFVRREDFGNLCRCHPFLLLSVTIIELSIRQGNLSMLKDDSERSDPILNMIVSITWSTPKSRTSPSRALRNATSMLLHEICQQKKVESQSKENRINLAIQAIQRDKKLSRRCAAQIYNVPESTLCDRINGKTPKAEVHPKAHRLTITKEEAIVKYVLDLDMRELPSRLAGIEDMANLLLSRRDGGHVGKH